MEILRLSTENYLLCTCALAFTVVPMLFQRMLSQSASASETSLSEGPLPEYAELSLSFDVEGIEEAFLHVQSRPNEEGRKDIRREQVRL